MASNLQRWHKLVELAEIEMDNAGKTVAYMQEQFQNAQQQLESLKAYTDEYAQAPTAKVAMGVIELRTHQAFGEKLHQAIAAQTQQVTEKQEMVEKALDAWREKRARLKALQSLYDKKQKQMDSRLSRQEQKMLDELASQQAFQNSHSHH
ncbi:flagellar export protein FliJ [Thiomicrorhabdus xiamenensis]|uniref:Flagellar FliJ protein n=1 Tax=Thiomicrorhabdus xiamenensis TaxID=2739063 RepID=A0A7D4TEM6_9GAMM|nr:flagellar export protein FliJ [Thiomicrorhabdus xiamenensis]QKI89547.1 flagellar export protein FliJ [Thiomicrorhabdus xiamenensis]